MLKEKEMKDYTFRLMSPLDYEEFKAACSLSPKELTEFLSLGRFMDKFNVVDFWNSFSYFINSNEVDAYGLFEKETLVGFATMSHSNRSFGCELTYWIRHGYHGKGLGRLFMFHLLTRALGPKGFLFAELIIDQENHASVAVAEGLGLNLIRSWEDPDAGVGSKSSGNFHLYAEFENLFKLEAESRGMTPKELMEEIWMYEALGAIKAIPHKDISKPPKRVTLRETLRFTKRPKRKDDEH